MWHLVTLWFTLTFVLHMKVTQQNRGPILWKNSAGIEGITQFILRSLLHVMANPAWGVKMANESSVFLLFPCHIETCTHHLYPVWDIYICSFTLSLRSSLYSLTFKGIKRYASNQTKSTPMFDFLCHRLRSSTSEMQLEVVEWSFTSLSPPNYCFKASSCLNVL